MTIRSSTIYYCSLALTVTPVYGVLPAQQKFDTPLQVPSCGVSASNNGIYEFGKIPSGLINNQTETSIPVQKRVWTISCTNEIYLGIRVQDNRSTTSTRTESWQLGLGSVNGRGKIGYYEAWLLDTKIDGKDAALLQEGRTFTTTGAALGNYVLRWVNPSGAPQSGKIFSGAIEVRPVLATLGMMNGPVTDITEMDGSMTLNFTFGI